MFRMGKAEADAVARAIEAESIFKVNKSLQLVKGVEDEMCRMFGCDYSIFMTSGYAALTAALVAMGIGPGDEVIVPAYTYISSAMAVVGAGAIPIVADIDETLTLDPKDFEARITPRTKAVIPVHIQGFPCNMDAICEVAKRHNIMVLEDACQADGGSYKGKRLGTVGDAGALSFNYYKVISCGEGGALFTNNREIFENSLIYHDSGAIAYFGEQLKDFTAEQFCGAEYRTNDLSAAILGEQLKRLDGILADLRKNKKYLADRIKDKLRLAPTNDAEGDCGTTIAIQFDTVEEAIAFDSAENHKFGRPINTGKHVYINWTPIVNKRGAFHPLMDPFKMEANKDIKADYSPETCARTLDILARTVYIGIDPNKDEAALDALVERILA